MNTLPPPQRPNPFSGFPPQQQRQGLSGGAIAGIIVGSVGAILVVCLVLVAVLALLAPSTSSTNGSRTASTQTVAATATPKGPHIITGATLGGTQDAFTAAYGQPDTSHVLARYQTTLPDGAAVSACYCTTAQGLDGQQRLELFDIGPASGASWTSAETAAAVKLFSPPDAIYVRTDTDPDVGPIQVYRSADLAKTFPPSAFTMSAPGFQPLPPGAFSVTCHDPNRPSGSGCSIDTGE